MHFHEHRLDNMGEFQQIARGQGKFNHARMCEGSKTQIEPMAIGYTYSSGLLHSTERDITNRLKVHLMAVKRMDAWSKC
jgi:RNase P protein component